MSVREKIREKYKGKKRTSNPDRKTKDLAMPAEEISPTTAADLRSSGYNPRTITPTQLEALKNAMREFGDLGGIVFNRTTGRLVSGHQRGKNLDPAWTITKEDHTDTKGTVAHGYVETPDGRFSYREVAWDEAREKAANIAANQHGGDFDFDLLAQLTKEIEAENAGLLDFLGFDNDTLKDLLADTDEGDLGDPEAIVEPVEDPFVQRGDLWVMGAGGEHRLLCGDSTNLADIDRLMNGEKADLCVTDPPYGVSYESKAGKIENDDLVGAEFKEFLSKTFAAMEHALKKGGAYYCYHAEGNGIGDVFRSAINETKELMMKQCIIWVKNCAVLGRNDYNWLHEPCLYGWRKGASHYFNGDFSQTTVIDDHPNTSKMDKKQLQELVAEMRNRIPSSVIRVDKPAKSPDHPTAKPVRLFEKHIIASSKTGQTVIDLFSGSGTTIISCRKTGRRGRGMEFDPKYAQASLMRYRIYTGDEPLLLLEDGKTKTFSQVEKERKKAKVTTGV